MAQQRRQKGRLTLLSICGIIRVAIHAPLRNYWGGNPTTTRSRRVGRSSPASPTRRRPRRHHSGGLGMSHLVEKMFSVRQVPWHGLGQVLDAPPTVEEGLRLAGLDWTVSMKRLFTGDGVPA